MDEKCFGLIEWSAARNSANYFSQNTQQWRGVDTEPCPLWSKTEFNRCLKIMPRSKETLTAPLNAVWLWGW